MKHTIQLLLLICLPAFGYSQYFGKYEKADLSKEHSMIDSSASMEILFKRNRITYEFTSTGTFIRSETFKRIKVYSEDGIASGNIELTHDPKEEIYFTKAFSYNLENGKVVKQKLANKNVYEEKTNEYYHTVTFAVPNVKVGSIIEVMYSLRTPYIYSVPKFYFQEDVPIIHAEFEIEVPKYFGLNPVSTGVIPLDMKKSNALTNEHGEVRYTYTATNVPSIKDDEYVLNINDYRSSLRYELHSTAFPNSTVEYYTKDWQQIATNLMESRSFGKQIVAKEKGLSAFVETLEGQSEDEKILSCYQYVLDNYTWDETYGIRSSDGVAKTFDRKKGSAGELNILLINLINKCGINTYPYLTRRRQYGIFSELYPSLANLSYLMACVEKEDGSVVFLDATNTELPVGQLPLRAINVGGLIIKNGNAIMYNFANPNEYSSRALMNYTFDESLDVLIGDGEKVVTDYAALVFKNKYEKKDKSNFEQDIENDDFEEKTEDSEDEVDITYITNIEGLDDKNGKINYSLSESNKKSVQRIDNKIYLESTLGYGLDTNPFMEESREFPIFYNYVVKIAQVIKLTIPDGYELESKPEDFKEALPNNKVVFSHSMMQLDEKTLAVNIHFQVKSTIILPEEYVAFKAIFDNVLKRSNEKIVLVKKE